MPKWIAIEFVHESQFGVDTIHITISRMVSPFYDGERWAVRRLSCCLNRSGEWEREPIPSSRDDAFYRRCRFDSFDEAAEAAKRQIELMEDLR